MALKAEKLEQISVFLENRPGVVADLCNALIAQDIDIRAVTVLDTADIGTVRLVVDDPELAKESLQTAGAAYVVVPVLGIELPNRPGAFGRIASKFAAANVNIEYVYSTSLKGMHQTLAVFRVPDDDVDRALALDFDTDS